MNDLLRKGRTLKSGKECLGRSCKCSLEDRIIVFTTTSALSLICRNCMIDMYLGRGCIDTLFNNYILDHYAVLQTHELASP